MDAERMKKAGELAETSSWTDYELEEVIKGTTLALAYLQGRGRDWYLASSRLLVELNQLETYKSNRKFHGKWNPKKESNDG